MLLTEVCEFITLELRPVVRDDLPWEPKSAYNVLDEKDQGFLSYNACHRLGFILFGEVIHSHNRVLDSSFSHWKRSNEIDSPNFKGPW